MKTAAKRFGRRRLALALTLAVSVGSVAGAAGHVEAKGERGGGKAKQATATDSSTSTTTSITTTEPSTTTSTSTEPSTTTSMSTTSDSSTATTTSTDTVHAADEHTSLATIVAQIGADDMWAAGYTGAGVDVAVIDTGVAPVTELSTSDVFVGPDLSFEGGVDELAGLDSFGHGTHMIGIIAGRTPGADPLAPRDGDFIGVAPDAGVVSVKVADNTGAVDVSQVIAAIDWVVQNRNTNGLNIRVLNLSYNTSGIQSYRDDPLSKAVENAWHHGIVVVVSAGNEGHGSKGLANPATNPYVLAVSSAVKTPRWDWYIPSWAPTGDRTRNPDVVAPGVSVMSLRVPGSRIDTTDARWGRVPGDDRLFFGSGTSQSAAVVSGAAALLLQQRPDMTPDQLKQLLTSTAAPVDDRVSLTGSGVIDLAAAMNARAGDADQRWRVATGLGSLEAARGENHVGSGDAMLVGEFTVTGAPWDAPAWVAVSESATAWTGADDWSGSTWSGSTWSGSTWSGSSWS